MNVKIDVIIKRLEIASSTATSPVTSFVYEASPNPPNFDKNCDEEEAEKNGICDKNGEKEEDIENHYVNQDEINDIDQDNKQSKDT